VGYFVTLVIFKCRVNHEEDFSQFLQRINRELPETLTYQHYPPELVFEDLNMRFPHLQVAFNMLNMNDISGQVKLEDMEPRHLEDTGDAKFDIELYAAEYQNRIEIVCNYRRTLFGFPTIRYIADTYLNLLDNLSQDESTQEAAD
jgi:non-ribosomal peptide synthetase component F